jgi:membrane-bound metal-dependent hydrolase YbcI (DUF457 family)
MNERSACTVHQVALPSPLYEPNQPDREALRTELLSLSFHAFEACMQDLLRSLGYTQVHLLDRTMWRQRTRHGGHDLTAASCTGVTHSHILIQVKQYSRPVSRRFIDELRGALVRAEADHGLIITTGTFSKVARRAALSGSLAPIRWGDGEELLDLLIVHEVGVQRGKDEIGHPQVDATYFAGLKQRYPSVVRVSQIQKSLFPSHNTNHTARPQEAGSTGGTMLWRTHVLGGISALWVLQALPHDITPEILAPLILCASVGALAPDLDAPEAKIKYLRIGEITLFAPLAEVLHKRFGHRGLLHSAAGIALCGVVALPLLVIGGWPCYLAFLLGYSSHLALDACTRSGIPLWTGSSRRIYLLPKPLRLVTGTPAEEIVVVLLGSATLLLVMQHLVLVSLP